MTQDPTPTTLSGGYAFTECPRWHDGRLWFVDMHMDVVMAVDEAGTREVMAELPEAAGGIGWLPDGRLLAVGHDSRKIYRQDPSGLSVHADLSDTGDTPLNDMWVDQHGRAYVGEFGFDVHEFLTRPETLEAMGSASGVSIPVPPGNMFRIETDGSWSIAAADLSFPNGILVDENTRTLIVAETFAAQLSAYDLTDDGELTNRQVWPIGFYPDGIGFDNDGMIWVSDPVGLGARLIDRQGHEQRRVHTTRSCLACTVGGADMQTLFLCTSPTSNPGEARRLRMASIESLDLA